VNECILGEERKKPVKAVGATGRSGEKMTHKVEEDEESIQESP